MTGDREHSATDDRESEAVISIQNLRKTFDRGQVVACEDIDLDIRHNEFVVLLGPSGCGKTTTLRCISGLDRPDSGSILISDEDVVHKKPKDRDLAFVFQSIALFPHMSVRRNIRFGLDMASDLDGQAKNDRVDEVAEILGIGDLLDRKPSALSGGQQQRVSLGRAMVMEPTAFLLDEPFSALDAQLRDQMQTEVKRLQRELDTAMVFVTHDQEEAMTLGDKIVVMDDGYIQQVGSPYEIYNEPTNLFVANFIGSPSANMLDCVVEHSIADALVVSTELFEVTLDPDDLKTDSLEAGEEFTLVIRPENFEIVETANARMNGDVTLIEPRGDRDVVFLDVDGVSLSAVVVQNTVDREADSVGVDLDEEHVWLFDESGERVL